MNKTIFKPLIMAILGALIYLFVVPITTFLFTNYAMKTRDLDYIEFAVRKIDETKKLNDEEKITLKNFYIRNPPSSVCASDLTALAEYREATCYIYSEIWQYSLVKTLSFLVLILTAAGMIVLVSLGVIASISRQMQYKSFTLGWGMVRAISAIAMVLQGSFIIWLSFWISVFFLDVYAPKLIFLVAFAVAAAIGIAINGVYKKINDTTSVAGGAELAEADAPELWENLRRLSQELNTAPPNNVIVGIDSNFFVTEAKIKLDDVELVGRTLFISLPLLHHLTKEEANAVFGHELGHFLGGDATNAAALNIKLVQYQSYCGLMYQGGFTKIVYHLMVLYRLIFEISLKREIRNREFIADGVAGALISKPSLVSALIKVAAYSSYRASIEKGLFALDSRQLQTLNLSQLIDSGLSSYVGSEEFKRSILTSNVVHPFDTHPPIIERVERLGGLIDQVQLSNLFQCLPKESWVNDINNYKSIENQLWAGYEQDFTKQHEINLAYRYLPRNAEETNLVEKFFPSQVFRLSKGQEITVSYNGLKLPATAEYLEWERVIKIKFKNGYMGEVLVLVHPEKFLFRARKTKIKLPGLSTQSPFLRLAVSKYWHRHRIARGNG